MFEQQPAVGACVELEFITRTKAVYIPRDTSLPIVERMEDMRRVEVVLWCGAYKRDPQVRRWRYALSFGTNGLNNMAFTPALNPQPRFQASPFTTKERRCLGCGSSFVSESAHNRMCPSCGGEMKRKDSGSMA